MKKTFFLLTALVVAAAGCNRSGMVDAPAPASTASANAGGKSSAPLRISHGREVNIQDYVVAGKTTIFDFTSEYCPPCRAVAPHLHKLHASRPDIVVVEVDINRPGLQGIDFESPVARQYSLGFVPNFKVYGPDGRLQAEGEAASTLVYSMLK